MAAAAFGAGPKLDGPVAVRLIFTVPRPKSAKKSDVVPFRRAGDLDKLARAALDSVVTAGLLNDDAQVADFWRLAKCYPGRDWDSEGLPVPGVIMSATEIVPGRDAGQRLWVLSKQRTRRRLGRLRTERQLVPWFGWFLIGLFVGDVLGVVAWEWLRRWILFHYQEQD